MNEVIVDSIKKLAINGGNIDVEGVKLRVVEPGQKPPIEVSIEISKATIRVNEPKKK